MAVVRATTTVFRPVVLQPATIAVVRSVPPAANLLVLYNGKTLFVYLCTTNKFYFAFFLYLVYIIDGYYDNYIAYSYLEENRLSFTIIFSTAYFNVILRRIFPYSTFGQTVHSSTRLKKIAVRSTSMVWCRDWL